MTNQPNLLSDDINRKHLHADWKNCFGQCCVALPFAASADFAMDKEGGNPCANLQSDFRCRLHKDLRQKGFKGCTVYELNVLERDKRYHKPPSEIKDWRMTSNSQTNL